MGVFPCDRCRECGSNLATGPDLHEEPRPHQMIATKVETDSGEGTLTRCTWCGKTRKKIEALGDLMENSI